ncbi:MAG: BlaI/MecI/CopY family transcriptional regulator [Deltaproteobacteria bacterium]|nr:BlaI/MecI/CopY family transcriptional regulator [Deltaproteobacteria bacterium]
MGEPGFSRREREMMEIIYRLGQATAAEVLAEMTEPPKYSSVRSTLNILERKGHLRHEAEGNRYVYLPTVQRSHARRSALDQLVSTFFEDSPAEVVTALLEVRGSELSDDDLQELSALIEAARREGR